MHALYVLRHPLQMMFQAANLSLQWLLMKALHRSPRTAMLCRRMTQMFSLMASRLACRLYMPPATHMPFNTDHPLGSRQVSSLE